MPAELREDIDVSVFIYVDKSDAVSLVTGPGESNISSHIGKCPVTVVAKQAIGFQPADLRISSAEIDVDISVVIDVRHPGAHRAGRKIKLGIEGRIGERAGAIVAEQAARIG